MPVAGWVEVEWIETCTRCRVDSWVALSDVAGAVLKDVRIRFEAGALVPPVAPAK
jgi:hypothetical protein